MIKYLTFLLLILPFCVFSQKDKKYEKDTLDFFSLAESYVYMEMYSKALDAYNEYYKTIKNNRSLKDEITLKMQHCKWAITQKNEIDHWTHIKNLGDKINSQYSEYSPIFSDEDTVMLFTSRRPESTGGKKDKYDDMYFEDMYFAKTYDGKNFEQVGLFNLSNKFTHHVHNTKDHDAIVNISLSKKYVYIYRAKKLYSAQVVDGKLSHLKILPKNINMGWYQSHISTTMNDSIAYFTSDKPSKSEGGIDIFTSKLQKDGTWSEAKNIGNTINTPWDEESPLISEDGKTLYFASKGHKGFGGYDLFYSHLENGKWTTPKNIGMPINSGGDDLYLSLNSDNKFQYVSSSRKEGLGQMDIYHIDYRERPHFTNCLAFQNKEYPVHLNAQSAIDTNGAPKNYQWLFHDSTSVIGNEAEYTYNRPGKYPVQLNVIDLPSGYIEYQEETFEIKIDSVDYINFDFNDTVSVDSVIHFNASSSQLKNRMIEHYWWDFGNNSSNYLDTMHTNCTYNDTGTYLIKMEVGGKDSKSGVEKFCIYKPITVLSHQKYQDYLNEKSKRDSILDNHKRLLSNQKLNDESNELSLKSVDLSRINIGNPQGIQLQPIYFDFDKAKITYKAKETLRKNVLILKSNDKIVLKILAHTDSRGSNKYNKKLSERRATNTYKWLLRNGIHKDRIALIVSLGEEQLLTDCPDDKLCSSEEHQLNRRAEFEIIGTLK